MNLIGYIVRIWQNIQKLATKRQVAEESAKLREQMYAFQFEMQIWRLEQDKLFERILAAIEPLPAVGFVFTVEVEGKIYEGATEVPMTNSQKAVARIKPVGTNGRPAVLDGVPAWASADETLATVVAAEDGLSATITPTGPLTDGVKITVSGDGDLGDGVRPIFGEIMIPITAGSAVGIEITLDPATEQ